MATTAGRRKPEVPDRTRCGLAGGQRHAAVRRRASNPVTFCSNTAGTSASTRRSVRVRRTPGRRRRSRRSTSWTGANPRSSSVIPARSGARSSAHAAPAPRRWPGRPPTTGPSPRAGWRDRRAFAWRATLHRRRSAWWGRRCRAAAGTVFAPDPPGGAKRIERTCASSIGRPDYRCAATVSWAVMTADDYRTSNVRIGGATSPASEADERTTLLGFLQRQRDLLVWKVSDASDETLASVRTESGLTMHGVVRHLENVERGWFRDFFAGETICGSTTPRKTRRGISGPKVCPSPISSRPTRQRPHGATR